MKVQVEYADNPEWNEIIEGETWNEITGRIGCTASRLILMKDVFDVYKSTRVYHGYPYCGPSSDNEPQRFDTREEAVQARTRLFMRNPVGWVVHEYTVPYDSIACIECGK